MDREKKEMLRTRRWLPLSTSTFNYDSYHNLAEVRKKPKIRGILREKMTSWNCCRKALCCTSSKGRG